MDTDTAPATWAEQNAALTIGDVGTIPNIDFDGFKVGKVTFIDNYMLQDSIINLDAYVSQKIAESYCTGFRYFYSKWNWCCW